MDLDTLLRESDVVTLHCPLTEENHHLLNDQAFAKMKDQAILINTARGALVKTPALLDAMRSGKLGGCALDVLEGEGPYFFHDCKNRVVNHPALLELTCMPNAIVTPHLAF